MSVHGEFRSGPGALLGLLAAALVTIANCTPATPSGLPGVVGRDDTLSVTLAWDTPTTDAAGRPLTDLASFRIYFGQTTPLTRNNSEMIQLGTQATHRFDDLAAGTYFFAVSAVDDSGNESGLSAEVSALLEHAP